MKQIGKHLRILGLLTRNYILTQLEYRCSFFTFLLVECMVLASKLVYVDVTYNLGILINGMQPDEILLFNGIFFVISGIYGGVFMLNFNAFQNNVKNGNLDAWMVKPVSLQFMCSVATLEPATMLPNVAVGIWLIAKAWRALDIPMSAGNVLGCICLTAAGVVILYNLLFAPLLLSFVMIRTSSLIKITSALSNFNMMPMQIYPDIMRRVGVFILPIFVVTNFPGLFVLGRLSTGYILWAFAAAAGMSVLVRILWKRSVRRYASAMG